MFAVKNPDPRCLGWLILLVGLSLATDAFATGSDPDRSEPLSGGDSQLGAPPTARRIPTGDLLVATYPEGATIRVNSEIIGTTPMEPRSLEPGWHLIQAEKADLFASARVHVRAWELTTVALTLKGGRGILSVLSSPDGASVFLDGEPLARTPVTLEDVRAGYHDLRIHRGGYLDHHTTVEVADAEESKVDIHLQLPAIVELQSTPEGADVYLGDRHMGQTPLRIDSVRPGTVEVTLRRENFEDWTRTLILVEGDDETAVADLVPRKRAMSLFSDPPGASIEIDGERLGVTPLRWAVALGERQFTFGLPGYEDYRLRMEIGEDIDPNLSVRLSPLKGYLTLRSAPAGARVTLLGRSRETWQAPLAAVALDTGPKVLRLEAPGYETREVDVEVHEDRETVLEPEWIAKSRTGGIGRVLVPGWSQRYQGKRIRGILVPVAQVFSLVGLLVTTNAYNDAVDEYDTSWERYLNEVAPEEIERAWREAQDRHDRVEDKRAVRNVFFAAAVGVYVYNLIDATVLAPEAPRIARAGVGITLDSEAGVLLRARLSF